MKRLVLALILVGCSGGDGGGGPAVDSGPSGDDGSGDDGSGDDGNGDDGNGDDGSGDDGSGDDIVEYVSGTRIRRRIGTTPDGAKTFLGWRDTMLNIDCGFSFASDGVQRCLPATGASISLFFSDAQCLTGLAFVTSCPEAPAPKYGFKTDPASTCGGQPRSSVHLLGSRYSGAIFYGSSAQCAPYPGAPPPYAFFAVGAPVAATTFQSMTESVE
jgi:hypothetical protein